jgi:hypothetical protein
MTCGKCGTSRCGCRPRPPPVIVERCPGRVHQRHLREAVVQQHVKQVDVHRTFYPRVHHRLVFHNYTAPPCHTWEVIGRRNPCPTC